MHSNRRGLLFLAMLIGLSSAGLARASTLQVTVTLRAVTGHLVVAPPGRSTQADTPITYLFLLHNTITTAETFRLRLTCPSRWQAKLGNGRTDTQGPVAPGELVVIPVVVTPPKRIAVGATGTVTLSAVTLDRPQLGDADAVTTTLVGSGAGLTQALPAGSSLARGPVTRRAWEARGVARSGARPAWERVLSKAQARATRAEAREASALPSAEGEAQRRGTIPSEAGTWSAAGGADTGVAQERAARAAPRSP